MLRRRDGLLEPPDAALGLVGAAAAVAPRALPPFAGLRTPEYKYVEYETGERELYDLRADPNELQNQAGAAPAVLVSRLSSWLDALSRCSGASCRSIETTPP